MGANGQTPGCLTRFRQTMAAIPTISRHDASSSNLASSSQEPAITDWHRSRKSPGSATRHLSFCPSHHASLLFPVKRAKPRLTRQVPLPAAIAPPAKRRNSDHIAYSAGPFTKMPQIILVEPPFHNDQLAVVALPGF